ncbi:unnamed protein product, partial [marine sediment metagenome]
KMKKETENKVIKLIRNKEKPTTAIASILGRNYYDAIKILEELEEKNKITKITLGHYTFWKAKKKYQKN